MSFKRLVFVRHGHFNAVPDRDHGPLDELGESQARAAGAFLRDLGIVPDNVCTTKTVRTRRTAELLCEELGRPELAAGAHRDAGFTSDDTFTEKLAAWSSAFGREPETLLFVGHHPTQHCCVRDFGGPGVAISKDARGVVLVYEKDAAGKLRLVHHHPAEADA